MERQIKIKTKDNHIIYGTLTPSKSKSDKLIIFVHGLTGYQNEHIYYNAAKFFPPKAFATFRFDFYAPEKKARLLSESRIKNHTRDLRRVIQYFRNRFKKIFLIGHSLGGAIILQSDMSAVNAIVLWDSSHYKTLKNKGVAGDAKYNKCLKAYVLTWGLEYIIGKKMYEEWMNFPTPRDLMNRINKPIKIIVAGKGILVKGGKEYFRYAKPPKSFSVIKNASHNFDEEGAEGKLFKETLSWIKKY